MVFLKEDEEIREKPGFKTIDKELIDKELNDLLALKERFLTSFPSEEKERGEIIFNYIRQQLNEMSLMGELDFPSYCVVVRKAVKGLMKLIYGKLIDIDHEDQQKNNKEILNADIMFAASRNFLIFLLSRASGKDREIKLKEIEAKRPMYVGK